MQAKKFVEDVPQVIQSDVSKEAALKLKTALEAVGGIVELEWYYHIKPQHESDHIMF